MKRLRHKGDMAADSCLMVSSRVSLPTVTLDQSEAPSALVEDNRELIMWLFSLDIVLVMLQESA